MIHTGVYGVGSRISARSSVSFCMAAIISSERAVEESADRFRVIRMQVDVVVAEALELHPFDRAAPLGGELVAVVRAHDGVGSSRDDEGRDLQSRRARARIEAMAQQQFYGQPRVELLRN